MCTAQRAEFRSCQFITRLTPSAIRRSIRNGSKRSGGRTAAKPLGIGSKRWWTKLGGGELVFADTLLTYWNKIVITDPSWRPSPHWRVEGGFDHGKTNPTALLRAYIDGDGVIYFCGEYYVAGKEVWEHARDLRSMPDINHLSACYADPTIFDCTMQQSINPVNTPTLRQSAKSINNLYEEQGIQLFCPFALDRSDVGFAARLMLHW